MISFATVFGGRKKEAEDRLLLMEK